MNKVVSLFSGVGGIDLAFEQAGFSTIFANDIDEPACKTFSRNFNIPIVCDDIKLQTRCLLNIANKIYK